MTSQKQTNRTSASQRILLVVFGLILCLIFLEIVLRVAGGFMLAVQQGPQKDVAKNYSGDMLRILFLGESTTANGYPNFVQKRLEKQYEEDGLKIHIINKGYSGTNSGVILKQLPRYLDEFEPNLVVTMIGINDSNDTLKYEFKFSQNILLFFKSFRVYKLLELMISRTSRANESLSAREFNKALENLANNQDQEAVENYKKAILLDPQNHMAHAKLIQLYRHLGDEVSAEVAYENALDVLNTTVFEYRFELARHGYDLFGRKEGKEHEQSLRKSLRINPGNTSAHASLALHYLRTNRKDQGEKILQDILKNHPTYYIPQKWLMDLYAEQDRRDKSAAMIESIVQEHPEYLRGYMLLAKIYSEMGNEVKAKNIIKQMKEVVKDNIKHMPLKHNYIAIKERILDRGIPLVAVQYPTRDVDTLKHLLDYDERVYYVDNEESFINAVEEHSYWKIFRDRFAGDFGHMTDRGKALLADHIADVIINQTLKKESYEG